MEAPARPHRREPSMPTSAPARSDAQTPAEGNVFSRAMRPVNTVVELSLIHI